MIITDPPERIAEVLASGFASPNPGHLLLSSLPVSGQEGVCDTSVLQRGLHGRDRQLNDTLALRGTPRIVEVSRGIPNGGCARRVRSDSDPVKDASRTIVEDDWTELTCL